MTGFDRLSYQSRWLHVAPERKFLLWLLLMVLAFTLPPLGQGTLPAWGQALTLALTAALTCWLLRVSLWRWCRWMALPFGFLLVGVLTIVFSVSRDPQMLLASLRLGAFSIGISAPGLAVAGETFWRSLAAMAATLWLVLNLPFPQLIILLKRGRVPRLLTEQILLTWRFIFILLDEAMAIHRAQTLRFGYGSVPQGYRSLAMLVGLLFTRVLLRYQQMSTALDIMNLSGLLRPQQGAVLWQGEALNYSKRGLLALRQQVATVFQDPDQQIFYTDIDSDIAFSLRNLGVAEEEIARRVDEALTLVDAQGFRQQPIQCLSHGQKKRVAIAGALVLQARYLLLDEPTSIPGGGRR